MRKLSSYTGGGGQSTACDHSGNFPRNFTVCLACGKKGVYKMATPEARGSRCKYCKDEHWTFTSP